MFGSFFKQKAKDAFSKVSGKKDALEAMCAACALVAAAEGGISDDEEVKAIKIIKEKLKDAFSESEIEQEFIKRSKQTSTRSGKRDLMGEIEQAYGQNKDIGEAIVLLTLDVADEGGIGKEEEEVMRRIAAALHQNYDKLAA